MFEIFIISIFAYVIYASVDKKALKKLLSKIEE